MTRTELQRVADLMAGFSGHREWWPFPLTKRGRRKLAKRYYEALLADPGPLGPITD